jgi:hypothetical protein
MSDLDKKQCCAEHYVRARDGTKITYYCILNLGHPDDHKDGLGRKWVNDPVPED